MPSLPFDRDGNAAARHVVLLGAGASLAAWEDWGRIGPRPLLTNELIDIPGVQDQFVNAGFGNHNDDFEAAYSDLAAVAGSGPFAAEIQRLVRTYFDALSLPERPTLYDYLILALRPKDVIATFNWDPFVYQAFRRCAVAFNNRRMFPEIHFLHGNVRAGACVPDRRRGWIDQVCEVCAKPLTPVQLLFPVKVKDYNSDPLLFSEWTMVEHELTEAYLLTVFGYAAPATDIEAKRLLLDGWRKSPFLDLAQVEIVNIEDKATCMRKWDEFVIGGHAGYLPSLARTLLYEFPRRSCEGFAAANLHNSPWRTHPYPRFDDLPHLWEWVHPLVDQEDRGGRFTDDWGIRGTQ